MSFQIGRNGLEGFDVTFRDASLMPTEKPNNQVASCHIFNVKHDGIVRMAELTPTLSQALGRAISAYNAGELVEAEQLCQQIIAAQQDVFDALHLLALVQSLLGKKETAVATFDRALKVRPDYAEALSNRGLAVHELKRFDEALGSFEAALKVQPDHAEALSNRGLTLHELKRFDEALASFDQALKVRPDFAEALSNRGLTLKELKRFEEALASFDRALKVRPEFAKAQVNGALCRLLMGDLDHGWEENERRWELGPPNDQKRNFTQPAWLGANEITGKTILLHAEQGFGDAIQFCRYVPLVVERAAQVILEVQQPLATLMSSLPGGAQIISRGDPLPNFDVFCPLLSLPLAFGTRLETIPSQTPYLRASSQAVTDWKRRLDPRHHLAIGLAWSGNPIHPNDHNRSIELRSLLPLLNFDATFVSLQKDVRIDDVTVLQDQRDLLHFGDALENFSDTAALISNVDLVISVDTSVAHLAGALAKPVWVLLPFVPDWRWLLDRNDSPWYPTARLFRQDDARAWDNVIARVHAALYELVQCRS